MNEDDPSPDAPAEGADNLPPPSPDSPSQPTPQPEDEEAADDEPE